MFLVAFVERPLPQIMEGAFFGKKVIYIAYYILFICSHVYAMRQRKVLNDNEWTRWLKWMRNCFKYGTIGEQWEQIESERWFNPDFENFLNEEIIPKPGSRPTPNRLS